MRAPARHVVHPRRFARLLPRPGALRRPRGRGARLHRPHHPDRGRRAPARLVGPHAKDARARPRPVLPRQRRQRVTSARARPGLDRRRPRRPSPRLPRLRPQHGPAGRGRAGSGRARGPGRAGGGRTGGRRAPRLHGGVAGGRDRAPARPGGGAPRLRAAVHVHQPARRGAPALSGRAVRAGRGCLSQPGEDRPPARAGLDPARRGRRDRSRGARGGPVRGRPGAAAFARRPRSGTQRPRVSDGSLLRDRGGGLAAVTAVDRVIAVGAFVVLTGVALAFPPRPFGDAPEYLLMAESWAAHGSPELRPGDVEALRRRAAASGIAVSPDDALGNYFEGRDGRFYCYHFSFYPLLTLPARLALRAVGGDVLEAGPLTNAIALGGAIAAVLLLVPAGTWARRAAAALLLSSPALGFLLWPHPEVLSFAMATLALVAGSRGASGVATLCAAIASIQNPPLALLAVFQALPPGLADSPGPWSRGRGWLTHLAAGLALASPLFFLTQFSTPNLAAYETAGAHAMGIGKALSLMF